MEKPFAIPNSDRSMDEEIARIYVPTHKAVPKGYFLRLPTDSEEGIFIPNPVCICGHDLNWHGSDGCNHEAPGESSGPEAVYCCPCLCFDDRKEDR